MNRATLVAEDLVGRMEKESRLDNLAHSLSALVDRLVPQPAARDVLHGVWLGHPLHPMLTDLPIGSWTSAWLLDLVGGRRGARAAQMLTGFGCLTALPTALSGAVDWSRSESTDQRVGVVHAAANGAALVLYTASWGARRRGRRGTGIMLGFAGATAATVGGYLGGHLAFRRALGPNRVAGVEPPTDWTETTAATTAAAAASPGDVPVVVLDGTEILITPELHAGIANRCSHQGGPLAEGELVGAGRDRCVVCPWHASTFRLEDGEVVHGPATSPQPAYEARELGGRWQVRARRRTA